MKLPKRSEAKQWARETWHGACNVVMPTFTNDFKKLNPRAIAHDVQLSAKWGYWGTLLVSECGTTMDEYKQMIDIAAEAKPENFNLVVHGSFDTIEQVCEAAKYGADHGCIGLLLSYPTFFYPKTANEIYAYTKTVCEASDLGVILFAVPTWNFSRFDSTGFPWEVLDKVVELPTAVALKYEAGAGLSGMMEAQYRYADKILVSEPMEFNIPICVREYGMQWAGTSGYEYFADRMPQWFAMLKNGEWEQGMELFRKLQPARVARGGINTSVPGAKLIHRTAWKYMGWLNGMSGGPLRQPVMRLDDKQMKSLREGLVKAGFDVTKDPDHAFFEGRFPM